MNNYTKSTMRDRLCKSKIKVTTEDKNSIAYGIEYNDWEAGYLGESKRINLYDCEKNEIRKHCWEVDHKFSWDQEEVVDRDSMFISNKVKESVLWRILITLTFFVHSSNLRILRKLIVFTSVKLYCLTTLISCV